MCKCSVGALFLAEHYHFTAHAKYLMLFLGLFLFLRHLATLLSKVAIHKVYFNYHNETLHQPFQPVQRSPGFPSLFPKTKGWWLPKHMDHPHTSVREKWQRPEVTCVKVYYVTLIQYIGQFTVQTY